MTEQPLGTLPGTKRANFIKKYRLAFGTYGLVFLVELVAHRIIIYALINMIGALKKVT
jgi:hypothetical protein